MCGTLFRYRYTGIKSTQIPHPMAGSPAQWGSNLTVRSSPGILVRSIPGCISLSFQIHVPLMGCFCLTRRKPSTSDRDNDQQQPRPAAADTMNLGVEEAVPIAVLHLHVPALDGVRCIIEPSSLAVVAVADVVLASDPGEQQPYVPPLRLRHLGSGDASLSGLAAAKSPMGIISADSPYSFGASHGPASVDYFSRDGPGGNLCSSSASLSRSGSRSNPTGTADAEACQIRGAQRAGPQAEALMRGLTDMRLLGSGGSGTVYQVGVHPAWHAHILHGTYTFLAWHTNIFPAWLHLHAMRLR